MSLGCNTTITSGNDKFFYGWSDAVTERTQTFNFMPIFARNLSIIVGFLNFKILIFASKADDERILSHDAFSRSITQYRSHGRFHREIRSFSRRLFSHSISSKSKKITLFRFLT